MEQPNLIRLPSNTSGSGANFKTMQVSQVREELIKKLDAAHDLFTMNRDDMMIIIRHYKWNEDKMMQEWFDDQEKLKYPLGLEYDKRLDLKPEIRVSQPNFNEGYCLSCYEELTSQNSYALACKHTFCILCVKEHLKAKIESFTDGIDSRCMQFGCNLRFKHS